MKQRRLALCIGRRHACVVSLTGATQVDTVVYRHPLPRNVGPSISAVLRELLLSAKSTQFGINAQLSLSPADLACADVCEAPFNADTQLEDIAGTLAESRCAGETAENLAIDIARERRAGAPGGSRGQLIAIRHDTLDAIRSTLKELCPQARLSVVTSIPSALTKLLDQGGLEARRALAWISPGEVVIVGRDSKIELKWRAFPHDRDVGCAIEKVKAIAASWDVPAEKLLILNSESDEEVEITKGLRIPPGAAPAVGAALMEPLRDINLLRGARDAPKRMTGKLAAPIRAALVAAAIFVFGLGLWFDRERQAFETGTAESTKQEKKLHRQALPDLRYSQGRLLSEMRKRLRRHRKNTGVEMPPSALAFWRELATHMPDPEKIGLTVDSLKLGASEGQLVGRVQTDAKEPMRHANFLQTELNRSEHLTTRGEFQKRGAEVNVNIRLNYVPPKKPTTEVADR